VLLDLKTPSRDGSMHPVMSPQEFMQRLGQMTSGSFATKIHQHRPTAVGRRRVYANAISMP
jgi:hypothetical protein